MERFPALVSGNSNSIQFPVQSDWPFWWLYVNRSLPISLNIPSIFKVIKYWTQSNKYNQVNQDFGGCGLIKSLWRKISFGFYSDPPPPSPVLEWGQAFWVVSTGTEVRWVVAWVRGRIAECGCVGGCVQCTVSVCYVSTGNTGVFPWMLARCGFFSAPRQWLGHRDPHSPCNSLEGIQNLLFLRVVLVKLGAWEQVPPCVLARGSLLALP